MIRGQKTGASGHAAVHYGSVDVALVLFTRDLRVRDNAALARACARARAVLPLFVVGPALAVPPNRARFLAESVAVLREELRGLGGDLVIRRGDPAAEAVRLATRVKAEAVFVAGDVSRYAARRTERLARECARHRMALEVTPGHAVVPGELPDAGQGCSPALAPGGERAGLDRVRAWLDGPAEAYDGRRDDLAADGTSRLSAYLRFGCVSPLELARSALALPGRAEFCRPLAWRDFFHPDHRRVPGHGMRRLPAGRSRPARVDAGRGRARRLAGGTHRHPHRRRRPAAARRRGLHA